MVDFWKNKKVLITGHTGFKGTWLTLWLIKLGAKITGYSLEKYPNDLLFKECELNTKIKDTRGDISDFDKLASVFRKAKPELVFHLAAQPLVREAYKKPHYTFETNVLGTVNMLECIRLTDSVKSSVIITSDKVYENKEWIWGYRENDIIGGRDPYSCSKSCTEFIVKSYEKSYNINLVTARAGNIFGGGDYSKDRLIPDCVKAITKNKPVVIRNPNSVRPWQHVLDPTYGYIQLAEQLYNNKASGAWNFGPQLDSILSVKRIVDMFIKKWGSGKWIDGSDNSEHYEAKTLSLDISKSYFLLNWKPRLNVDEALNLTVDWYKNYSKGAYALCMKQIQEYESK